MTRLSRDGDLDNVEDRSRLNGQAMLSEHDDWHHEQAQEGEQEQALLTGHDGSDDGGDEPKRRTTKPEGLRARLLESLRANRIRLLLMLAFFLVLIPFPLLSKNRLIPYASTVQGEGVKSNVNYVLDPQWDFNAVPRRREYSWVIRDSLHNPDGVYRPMILINGQYPGPMVECNEGDTIVVHVDNQGINATSIHWHGIYQNGTNWMDGTVGVTQCAIAPGGKFTYEFQVNGQWGSYWYHAHQGVQSSDGLLGPLIIHSKKEQSLQKVPYVTDRVIMVQDHYHDTSSSHLMTYLAPDRENVEPIPDGPLINGVNVRNCDDFPQRNCSNATISMPTLNLAPEQNHRLRFINVGAFAEFSIQFDEHEFAVTEVDGTDIEPVYHRRLNINPGQRYSVILSTNLTTADSYWMRAKMVSKCFRGKNKHLESELKIALQYDRSNNHTLPIPSSSDWPEVIEVICKDMNSTGLVPVEVVSTPKNPDAFFYLRSTFQIGNWRLSRGFFNTSSWRADIHSPSLSRVIDGYRSQNSSFTVPTTGINTEAFHLGREMVLQVPGLKTIDIMVQNFDDGNHPLHLHGHKFFVIGQGHGYFRQEMYDSFDLSNPLRRDTASLEGFGWLLIRVITDNPGLWAFHCHISWHAQSGMMMQLLTQQDVVGGWSMPEANTALCKAQGLEKGEGPSDDLWVGDFGDAS